MVHVFPVEDINNLEIRDKVGFVRIESLGRLAFGDAGHVALKGWWRDEPPSRGTLVTGIFLVATPSTGVELTYDRSQVAVAPGDPEEEEQYLDKHFSNLPMQIHAFGLVTSATASSFTIKGQTFVIEEKKKFEVTFLVDGTDTGFDIPKVGSYAGALGTVTSTTNGLTARLDRLQDNVPHKRAGSVSSRSSSSSGKKWSSAWKAGSPSKAVAGNGTSAEKSTVATVGIDNDGLVFEAINGRIELRPGTLGSDTYMEEQLCSLPWRVRVAGRVTASKDRTFTMESCVDIVGQQTIVVSRWLVPDGKKSKRWANYKPVDVNDFISARGAVQTLHNDDEGYILTVAMEELQNSVRDGGQSEVLSSGASSSKASKKIWMAPSKSVQATSTSTSEGSTSNLGSSGRFKTTAQASSSGSVSVRSRVGDAATITAESPFDGVLTEGAFAEVMSARNRRQAEDDEGEARKRVRFSEGAEADDASTT
ncbi:hypothetical protein A4X03_0g6983 [Tilletia caries]|uniref:Uncharacterized protein n=1 Tax=Tilletia caries TaxID=13290 RepID=A0A8T8SV97_9BASI|nr:hypothetical protein A4X03_0g6983 [Tilletia caries]